MELSAKKKKIALLFDGLAKEKKMWAGRSNTYYRYLTKLVRHLIPDPQRVVDFGSGTGDMLSALKPVKGVGIDISKEMVELARKKYGEYDFHVDDAECPDLKGEFDTVLMVNLVGLLEDVYASFKQARRILSEKGRIVVVYYNHLWEPILRLAALLKLRSPVPYENWIPLPEMENLLNLTGYEVIRSGRRMLCPKFIPIISWFLNTCIAPLPFFQKLCLIEYVVARPVTMNISDRHEKLSCSVVIPTKDEKGNIRDAINRTPLMGRHTELIFVDGNSTDGTVEEIHDVISEHPDLDIKFLSQGTGTGKADAVRKGFDIAEGDVFMILDSDLTMPPEDLPKYFELIADGKAEFVNGCRLVYPMEKQAMRTLNKIANHFFGRAFSWLLEQRVRDTLCGTKVLMKDDYLKIASNRNYFGDFDPFGDFDLLFGAARLNLKIVDLPIRYRERTYGEIKISRFRHGFLLIKMCLFGLRKLKCF